MNPCLACGHEADTGDHSTCSSSMALPWAPYFGVTCPCGAAVAYELATPEDVARAERDPVEVLRSLGPKDQAELVAFWAEHEAHGKLEPRLFSLAPLPKA